VVTESISRNWSGRYIDIRRSAKSLARPDESPADILDAILSGVVRGDFDLHMKHKRASHPSERPVAYDDCDDWDSAAFIGGFLHYGGPNFGKPVFDPAYISREQTKIVIAGLSYGQYGELFRKSYIDPICIDEQFLIEWWKDRYGTKITHSAGKRGRKPKYDWVPFEAEAIRILEYEGGINTAVDPNFTQTALERQMADWCSLSNWSKVPEESQIREHVSKAIEKHRQMKAKNN